MNDNIGYINTFIRDNPAFIINNKKYKVYQNESVNVNDVDDYIRKYQSFNNLLKKYMSSSNNVSSIFGEKKEITNNANKNPNPLNITELYKKKALGLAEILTKNTSGIEKWWFIKYFVMSLIISDKIPNINKIKSKNFINVSLLKKYDKDKYIKIRNDYCKNKTKQELIDELEKMGILMDDINTSPCNKFKNNKNSYSICLTRNVYCDSYIEMSLKKEINEEDMKLKLKNLYNSLNLFLQIVGIDLWKSSINNLLSKISSDQTKTREDLNREIDKIRNLLNNQPFLEGNRRQLRVELTNFRKNINQEINEIRKNKLREIQEINKMQRRGLSSSFGGNKQPNYHQFLANLSSKDLNKLFRGTSKSQLQNIIKNNVPTKYRQQILNKL